MDEARRCGTSCPSCVLPLERPRRRSRSPPLPNGVFGSLGRPSTRSPTMLRWISAVPPQIVSEREKKNSDCRLLTG